MGNSVKISLDAMGGDNAPKMVFDGAELLLERLSDIEFLLYGDQAVIEPMLRNYPRLKAVSTICHCDVVIRMDEEPSTALRRGRGKSSMWQSIEAVKNKEAGVTVSAGNTGALMAMSRFCLKTMANIERPAIAAIWPTKTGESIVLDMGATIGADSQQLIDFSILGSALAQILFDKKRPTVGLLNVGVEEMKGVEEVRTAGRILRSANLPFLDYAGFVEGNDVGKGTVDVVVTEGFAGNIALKIAEGTANQITSFLRDAMKRTWRTRLGYLLAREAFVSLKESLDPRKHNGGVFLGLNGLVIKSHGGTDGDGYASALEMAYDMLRYDLISQISQDLSKYHDTGIQESIKESEEVS